MGYIDSGRIKIEDKIYRNRSSKCCAEFAKAVFEKMKEMLESIGHTVEITVRKNGIPENRATNVSAYIYAASLMVDETYCVNLGNRVSETSYATSQSSSYTSDSTSLPYLQFSIVNKGKTYVIESNYCGNNVPYLLADENIYQYFGIKMYYNETNIYIEVYFPENGIAQSESVFCLVFYFCTLRNPITQEISHCINMFQKGTAISMAYLCEATVNQDTYKNVNYINMNSYLTDEKILMVDAYANSMNYEVLGVKHLPQSITGRIEDGDGNKYICFGKYGFCYDYGTTTESEENGND